MKKILSGISAAFYVVAFLCGTVGVCGAEIISPFMTDVFNHSSYLQRIGGLFKAEFTSGAILLSAACVLAFIGWAAGQASKKYERRDE